MFEMLSDFSNLSSSEIANIIGGNGNKLAVNIKMLRIHKGMTQEELADELHISRVSVTLYEEGKRIPSLDIIMALSIFFDRTIDDIVKIECYSW
ncbi:XRE family transcriptional regulator [Weissella muntiaci]|uniref:XRE family transcriptional regulator n=1 Tax=Weissella muntiaci TaxID=2508881 RepID=A0A6C2C720_9LACO|nr:helix-turn-helix transcriptional regulator [Weissella muntiaci]TYC49587.1 XRE family transcriptional regulator [Weissella muntiaci]